jgi:membrane protein
MPGGVSLLLDTLQFILVAGGMAAMFHFVPNTHVRWGHAWMGGLFVSACMEVAKKLLALYLSKVPTYSVMYGAFATVPILLVWIYVAWVIVLLGAALTEAGRAGSFSWRWRCCSNWTLHARHRKKA